jgi:PhnB protein
MATFNIYLNLPGTSEEAFNFYKSVLGGEFLTIMRYKDSPEGPKTPDNLKDKIMHIALPIGKGNTLMATDSMEGMGPKMTWGNNVAISVNPESEGEARKIFDGLSAGGTVFVPLAKAFWGGLFGMFVDKFGINWMVNYDENHTA